MSRRAYLQSGRRPMALLLSAFALVACASDQPGTLPEIDAFYFPTGVALDYWRDPSTGIPNHDRPLLFVSNANADLRFNGGTLMVLDLAALPRDLSTVGDRVLDGSLACQPDALEPSRWQCAESGLVVEGATLRIGNFPGDLKLLGGRRIFTPVRGQNNQMRVSVEDHLMWADVVSLPDGGVDLRCNRAECRESEAAEDCKAWIECDEAHLVGFSQALDEPLPAEPFGIYANPSVAVWRDINGGARTCLDRLPTPPPCSCDESAPDCSGVGAASAACCDRAGRVDHLYVVHLGDGEVSLFSSETEQGGAVTLDDFQSGFFGGTTPVGGGMGVVAAVPGDRNSPVWATSRFDSNLASFVVRADSRIVQTERVPVGAIDPGSDLRGLALAPGGDSAFVVSQLPPSLVALDLKPSDQGGVTAREPLWVVEVCAEPTVVALGPELPQRAGDPLRELAYVVCFAEAALFVVDTAAGELVGSIRTGRGPNALTLDLGSQVGCGAELPCRSAAERCVAGRCLALHPRAFVANFLENTIGVIDLDPTHESYRRMVARIGEPRDLVQE